MSHLRDFIKCSQEKSSKMRWIKQAESQVLALYYSKCDSWNNSFNISESVTNTGSQVLPNPPCSVAQKSCVYAEVLDALSQPNDSWKVFWKLPIRDFTTYYSNTHVLTLIAV